MPLTGGMVLDPSSVVSWYALLEKTWLTINGPSHLGSNLPFVLRVIFMGLRTASTRSPTLNDLLFTFLSNVRDILEVQRYKDWWVETFWASMESLRPGGRERVELVCSFIRTSTAFALFRLDTRRDKRQWLLGWAFWYYFTRAHIIKDQSTIRREAGGIDAKPVSMRCCLMTTHPFGLITVAQKYSVWRFSTLVRLGGGGTGCWEVLINQDSKLSRHWDRVKRMAEKPVAGSSYPLEFWLCRGYPFGPYLRGFLYSYIREKLKPKGVKMVPEEFTFDGEVEILERTLVRNWVRQWLSYLH